MSDPQTIYCGCPNDQACLSERGKSHTGACRVRTDGYRTHRAVAIGTIGRVTVYIDVLLEEARRRWAAAHPGWAISDERVEEFTFTDELQVYDIWAPETDSGQ
jgi:hypothetical protein